MITDLIIFIVVLAVLIIAHELGHFLAAKKFGIWVEEFGIGFPPRIFSYKKGETVWSVNAVLLGGFVKIAGEDAGEAHVPHTQQHEEEPVVVVEKVSEAVAIARGGEYSAREVIVEKIYAPSGAALPDAVPPHRLFFNKPLWQRAVVLCAGVVMNFLVGWVILAGVFLVGSERMVVVADIAPGSPAQTAGIVSGDIIRGDFAGTDDFVAFINAQRGKEVALGIEHDGQRRSVTVVPRRDPPEGEGALGVTVVQGGFDRMSLPQALWESLVYSAKLFSFIFAMLFKLIASIFGGENLLAYVSGPVGIFEATSRASGLGIVFLANLVAIISLNLAALNIFPFPALDGGRLVFLGIEKIKGSPVSAKAQRIVNAVGLALLVVFLVYVTAQDIGKLL